MQENGGKPKKPRKNQDVLDFVEWLRNRLGDQNPRSFGLYMKLYKQYGRNALLGALAATIKKQDVAGKTPYFLGVVYRNAKEQGMRKEKRKKLKLEGEAAQAVRAKYEKLTKALKKKTTPAYQRNARIRSRMLHAVAKQERKVK